MGYIPDASLCVHIANNLLEATNLWYMERKYTTFTRLFNTNADSLGYYFWLRAFLEGEDMKETTTKARPAKHISFTKETFARLNDYIEKHFLGHRALSMLVDLSLIHI